MDCEGLAGGSAGSLGRLDAIVWSGRESVGRERVFGGVRGVLG